MRRAFAAAVLTLLATTVAGQSTDCRKEIIVYLDMSKSMTTTVDGTSSLRNFAAALFALFNTPGFLVERDSLRIKAFCDKVVTLEEYPSWTKSDSKRLHTLLDDLKSEHAWEVRIDQSLNREKTNIGKILRDVPLQADGVQRVIIIASDLAHDPENTACADDRGQVEAREEDAEVEIQDFKTQYDNLLTTAEGPRFAILQAHVVGACAADIGVARFVSDRLNDPDPDTKTLHARFVTVLNFQKDYRSELLQAISRPLQVSATGADQLGGPTGKISISVRNPNGFPILTRGIEFTAGGKTLSAGHPVDIAACSEKPIEAPVPPSMNSVDELSVAVVTTAGNTDPLEYRGEWIVLSKVTLHPFNKFVKGRLVAEIEGRARIHNPHTISVMFPDQKPSRFLVTTAHDGSVKFALPIAADAAAIGKLESKPMLKIEATGMSVAGEGSAEPATRGDFVPAGLPEERGHSIPHFAEWAAALTFLGGIIAKVFFRLSLRHALEAFHWLDYSRDICAFFIWLATWLPFPYYPHEPANVVWWSVIIGILAVVITRWLVIAVVWRLIEPPHKPPLPDDVARRHRRVWTTVTLVVGVLAFLTSGFLLSQFLSGAIVLKAASS